MVGTGAAYQLPGRLDHGLVVLFADGDRRLRGPAAAARLGVGLGVGLDGDGAGRGAGLGHGRDVFLPGLLCRSVGSSAGAGRGQVSAEVWEGLGGVSAAGAVSDRAGCLLIGVRIGVGG